MGHGKLWETGESKDLFTLVTNQSVHGCAVLLCYKMIMMAYLIIPLGVPSAKFNLIYM